MSKCELQNSTHRGKPTSTFIIYIPNWHRFDEFQDLLYPSIWTGVELAIRFHFLRPFHHPLFRPSPVPLGLIVGLCLHPGGRYGNGPRNIFRKHLHPRSPFLGKAVIPRPPISPISSSPSPSTWPRPPDCKVCFSCWQQNVAAAGVS